MFSDEIIATDAFLDMPSGSQLLYFHLGIRADDDGFISSPKMVMRILGSTEDELKVLFLKKFLLAFDSGVCVVKHWRINNQLRKDRYSETKYITEKSQLYIRPNGSYSFNPENALPLPKGHFTKEQLHFVNHLATKGKPSGNHPSPQYSIGKVSKDKERIDTIQAKVPEGTLRGEEWQEIIDAFEPVNKFYTRFYKNKTQRQAIIDILKQATKNELISVIGLLSQTNQKNYFPHIDTPVKLRDKWSSLKDALIRYKDLSNGKKAPLII